MCARFTELHLAIIQKLIRNCLDKPQHIGCVLRRQFRADGNKRLVSELRGNSEMRPENHSRRLNRELTDG
jgi:hypothetical protein